MMLRKKRLCNPGLNLSCVRIGPWYAVPYTLGHQHARVGNWNVDVGRGYHILGRKRGKRHAIRINLVFCNVVCLT